MCLIRLLGKTVFITNVNSKVPKHITELARSVCADAHSTARKDKTLAKHIQHTVMHLPSGVYNKPCRGQRNTKKTA